MTLTAFGKRFWDRRVHTHSSGNGSKHRCLHEITARESHENPPWKKSTYSFSKSRSADDCTLATKAFH
jgi:hypothetical protein